MRQLRGHVQWMGASALGLALLSGLTGCADRARWGDAKVRPDRRSVWSASNPARFRHAPMDWWRTSVSSAAIPGRRRKATSRGRANSQCSWIFVNTNE